MLNCIEKKILGIMLRTPLDSFSIYRLSKILSCKYSYVYRCVKSLQKKKLIKADKEGNTYQCRINFETAGIEDLAVPSIEGRTNYLNKSLNIKVIHNSLNEKLSAFMHITLLFGSYAKGTNKKDSDIDLFFIVEDEHKVDNFKKQVKSILSGLSYKTHIVVSTIDWFYSMINEKNSVGREVLKSSIVLSNAESYYNLVKKHDKERGY